MATQTTTDDRTEQQGQTQTRPMLDEGISLGRLFGVQVRLDWSLIIVFALVLFNLGAGVFPTWHPGWSPVTIWATAFAAAVLFFASVLVHELSHALAARAAGIPVPRITLFLFGGLAHMGSEPRSPQAEFWIAVVGPLTSLIIGVLATAGGAYWANAEVALMSAGEPGTVAELMHGVGPIPTLLLWLGPINLLLGAFNLLPGFPLDGGRVLRAALWAGTRDMLKATRWASGVGRVFAWTLIAIGVMNAFSGMLGQGLWLVLIGWFLNNAARASYQQLLTQHALENVPVSRVMWSPPRRVTPELTVERFVREHLMASDQAAFPVEHQDGSLLGMVVLDDVRKVPQQDWSARTVEQIMTPAAQLSTLPTDADATQALEVLAQRDVDQVPIVEGSHLEGLVRRRDVVRWISLSQHDGGPRGAHA